MQRVIATGVSGTGSPASPARPRRRAGMSPGGSSRRVVDVDDGAQRRRPRPQPASSAGQVRPPHSRTHSVSTHSPITLRRKRIVPSTPASLVKSASRASSVSTGASSSSPTSDQVPEEM